MTGGGGLCVGRDGDTAEATADGLARLCLKAGGCGHGRKPKGYRTPRGEEWVAGITLRPAAAERERVDDPDQAA
jgi:hypothetical protein